jgi:cyclopropane fatty-acyl-phospholipid synthase-like methyltransferase
MRYIKSNKYDHNFVKENLMGPNSLKILEELMHGAEIEKGLRVLDLGSGRGLTSIFLAKEYDVQVFAVDLWISPSDNYERFKAYGLDKKIIPLCLDASSLPFADDYFDAVISVDAYHYFGNNESYFDNQLSGVLKQDALVALAFPGMKFEVHSDIPSEMKQY